MRLAGVVGAAVLISGFGITVPAYSQHGNQGDRQAKHEDHGEHGKPGKGYEHREKHEPRRPEEHSVRYVTQGPSHVGARPEHRVVWQEHRARRWENEHRGWKERGGYHGYRVPHDRYIVYFGREHRFRVHTFPVVVVSGRPRFHYHDCWITLVDPWPEYWSTNWYENDDVYVEYANDGYYMYNARHPGVGIAINISL